MILVSESPLLKYIKWTATLSMMVSAVLISVFVQLSSTHWVFWGFLVGHVLWSFAAVSMKDRPLLMLNLTFLCIDIYAISIRLFQ